MDAMTTNRPKVLVILHNLDDNLNEMAGPLAEAGIDLVTWDVVRDVANTPAIADLGNFDGVISLGAHAGVLEEAENPWMSHERQIMEWALATETPLLGLCFGSQLLASAAGGQVYKSETAELGWTQVAMTEAAKADPVLSTLGENPDVFHFHYDTFDLPESAELLGETNGIKQAFRVGNKAWGTQFHIEIGLSQQLSWLTSYRQDFEAEGLSIEDQVRQTHERWIAHRDRSWAMGRAFAEQVLAQAATRA